MSEIVFFLTNDQCSVVFITYIGETKRRWWICHMIFAPSILLQASSNVSNGIWMIYKIIYIQVTFLDHVGPRLLFAIEAVWPDNLPNLVMLADSRTNDETYTNRTSLRKKRFLYLPNPIPDFWFLLLHRVLSLPLTSCLCLVYTKRVLDSLRARDLTDLENW